MNDGRRDRDPIKKKCWPNNYPNFEPAQAAASLSNIQNADQRLSMALYACRTMDYSGNCIMIFGKCCNGNHLNGSGPGPFPGNDIRQWSNRPISSDLR